jgi:glycerophosphoryl diester phosphodiesterase
MKRVKTFLSQCILLAGILLSCQIGAQNRVDTILNKLKNPNIQEVLVVAHRGDWRNFPENSIEAIESAIKMGVDIVELDIQKTRDGKLILMHDATLDRTTTGKGKVEEWTLDSIKMLKLKNGCAIKTKHEVPTLEEALIHAKGKILINLDKADRYFNEVYLLLVKTGTTRQIIMKGGKAPEEVKKQFGSYLNEVIYMPIVNLDHPKAIENIKTFMLEMNPVAFELLYKSKDSQVPAQIKQLLAGKSLIWYNTLWDTMAGGHDDDMALENPDGAYGYLIKELGARIIQTDRPAMLIEYLRKYSCK